MRLLLVGGTGVLSSAVATEALRQGVEVVMVNRGRGILPDGAELIRSDKDDYETISHGLGERKFDAVIDFLCFTAEESTRSFTFYSNYTKQYFFISSCAVYDVTKVDICTEDAPKVRAIWNYSVDKWASEQKLTELAKESDVQLTIIRPCVTYGDTRIPYGIAPNYGYHWTLAARVLAGKPIISWNGGNNRCNMTRVEDFAVGVVGLIGNDKAYGEAFSVCGDEAPMFKDVLDVLSEYLQKKVITVDIPSEYYAKEVPSRYGEILADRSVDVLINNDKIKSVVPSFKQRIFLKEGVTRTLDAYKAQNFQRGIDWKFDADTDRIIRKWCKHNGKDYRQYNLGFRDYLGTATLSDKLLYWRIYNRESVVTKLLAFMLRAMNLFSYKR